MSGVEFFSFDYDLSVPERGISEKIFIKTPKSPLDSYQSLFNRSIAYCYSYRKNLKFGKGLLEPQTPSAYSDDFVLFVDPLKPKEVAYYHRHHKTCAVAICFFGNETIFFNSLGLEDTKWIKDIFFYSISEIEMLEQKRLSASVTIVDETIFFNEITLTINDIDPLVRFQSAILKK